MAFVQPSLGALGVPVPERPAAAIPWLSLIAGAGAQQSQSALDATAHSADENSALGSLTRAHAAPTMLAPPAPAPMQPPAPMAAPETGTMAPSGTPVLPESGIYAGGRIAPDGLQYVPDPSRPGSYLEVTDAAGGG